MAFSENGEAFFVLVLWVYFDVLLGNVQEERAVIVDELGYSHSASLVDYFALVISVLTSAYSIGSH